MLAMFGIGPLEMLILGGLCCGGLGIGGIVVGVVVFVTRRNLRPPHLDAKADSFAPNQAPSDETRRPSDTH